MKRQQIISIILLFILFVKLLFNPVVYASDIIDSGKIINSITNDEIIWTLDNEGTLTIGGSGHMEMFTTYTNGAADTPWFYYRDLIKKVVVKEGVINVGFNAFYNCRNIEKIILPSTLKSFTSLKFCEKIKTVGRIGSGADYEYAFTDNIPQNAFYELKNLEIVELPEGIKTISDSAFYGCTQLKSVILPQSLERIENLVFSECAQLNNIEIPANVNYMGYGNFYQCEGLNNIKINTPNYIIENGILYNKEKTELIENILDCAPREYYIPENVNKIAAYAFFNTKSIRTIHIPKSVKQIDRQAFARHWEGTLINCYFYGDVPEVEQYSFDILKYSDQPGLAIYYPYENNTWNEENKKKIGTYNIIYLVDPNSYGELEEIVVNCPKKTYKVGEKLNFSVKAIYSSGYEENVSLYDVTISEYDMNSSGKKKITINYKNKSDSFFIEVHNIKDVLISSEEYPESNHNYEDNLNEWYIYTTQEDANYIEVKFSENTYIENVFDTIKIYDQEDKLIGNYSGSELAGKTLIIQGNTIKINLITDSGGNEYGFKIDSINVNYIEHEYEQIENIESTCNECGKIIYSCKICGKTKEEEKELAAHTEGIPVIENKVEATVVEEGSYDEVIYCSVCNKELSRTKNIIPKKDFLVGDVNNDGKVNIKDWNRMYDHINETSKLTDEEFERGDVNGDGKVNIKDWNRMYDHITEVNPLW